MSALPPRASSGAAEISTRIAIAFDAPLQSLHGFRHALDQLPQLGAAELAGYAQELARDQPALSGVHFLEYVRSAERAAFELRSGCRLVERARDGIRPAAERAEYLPIAVRGPWEPPELCGYDRLGPGGDNSLLKARETGQVVASVLQTHAAAEPTLSLAASVCGRQSEGPCAAAELRGVAELWLRVAPVLQVATRDLAAGSDMGHPGNSADTAVSRLPGLMFPVNHSCCKASPTRWPTRRRARSDSRPRQRWRRSCVLHHRSSRRHETRQGKPGHASALRAA